MAGYIYPELLDHVEYKVNYGSSPSISRADRKAVTVGNDICNCTEELDGLKDEKDFVNLYRHIHEPFLKSIAGMTDEFIIHSKLPYEYQRGWSDKPHPAQNHARNIRRLVMWEEIYPTPTMKGVSAIDKRWIKRAYLQQASHKALYWVKNKDRYEDWKEGTQWHRFSGAQVDTEWENFTVLCPDVLLNKIQSWLMHENAPLSEVLSLISLFHYGDVRLTFKILSRISRILGNRIGDAIKLPCCEYSFKGTKFILESCKDNYNNSYHRELLYGHSEYANSKLELKRAYETTSFKKATQYAITRGGAGSKEGSIENSMLFSMKFFNNSSLIHDYIDALLVSSSVDEEELHRRASNLQRLIGKHERLVHNLTPIGYGSKNYTTDVVKRLAMFYQAMDESRDVVSMKPKPTLAQGLSKELLTAYQPKDTTESLEQMMKELADNSSRIGKKPTKSGDQSSDYRWARTQIVTANLNKDMSTKLKTRLNRPSEIGTVPRYINRWHTDRMVWANKRRSGGGGTVGIDVSGSMSFNAEDIERIMELLPAAKIFMYAGKQSYDPAEQDVEGFIEIVANKQRRVENIEDTMIFNKHFGNNLVDMPAIKYLSVQKKPRLLVSDMECVAINGNSTYYENNVIDDCYSACKNGDILILNDIDDVIKYAREKMYE